MPARPPLPPLPPRPPRQKVRLAEDAWNTRDPERVALAYTTDSHWRNRAEFLSGREEIVAFLTRKWARELDYRLIKELWAFAGNRIAVRFAYEWHDDRPVVPLLRQRELGVRRERPDARGASPASTTCRSAKRDRKFHWPLGRAAGRSPGPVRARALSISLPGRFSRPKSGARRAQPQAHALAWQIRLLDSAHQQVERRRPPAPCAPAWPAVDPRRSSATPRSPAPLTGTRISHARDGCSQERRDRCPSAGRRTDW